MFGDITSQVFDKIINSHCSCAFWNFLLLYSCQGIVYQILYYSWHPLILISMCMRSREIFILLRMRHRELLIWSCTTAGTLSSTSTTRWRVYTGYRRSTAVYPRYFSTALEVASYLGMLLSQSLVLDTVLFYLFLIVNFLFSVFYFLYLSCNNTPPEKLYY